VITWIFAPIKFQADTGLLLAFAFVWNMLGALVPLPSLAYFPLPQYLFANTAKAAPESKIRFKRYSRETLIDQGCFIDVASIISAPSWPSRNEGKY
jgi:hypothetical protein